MNRVALNQAFYLSAVFITFVGNSLIFIAAGKTAFDQFGLASVFGVLLMLEFFQSLVLSGVAGWIVDRFPARNVAVAADLTLFAIEAGLVLLAFAGYEKWAVVLITFFVNLVKPFQSTATFSFVRQTFPKEMIFRINSRSAAALNAGYLVGLFIAGLLLSRVPLGTFIMIDAATYLLSAAFFAVGVLIPIAGREREPSRKAFPNLVRKYLSLARSHPEVVRFALLIGIQLNLTAAYNTLLFKNVAERYASHPSYLSLLEGVYTVSYLTVSALLGTHDRFRLSASRLWIPFAAQGACFAAFAAPIPIGALGTAVALFGALNPIIFSCAVTSLHEHTPDAVEGYVGGLKGSIQAMIALPLLALNATLADGVGLVPAFIFLAGVNLAAGWFAVRAWSAKRPLS